MRYVYSEPTPATAGRGGDNGIDQVVINLAKHLPAFGWSYTENRHEAELFAPHAGSQERHCDVAHCHGLYPTGVKGNANANWMFEVNRRVIDNLKTAKQITVPSQWVADILRRDMLIEPHVIGWGVNVDEWANPNPQGYVLWNKGRPTGVCDPTPLNELARRAPQTRFLTTFGDDSMPNMKVVGRQPYDVMKRHILGADIYLATTKETFGIGTLEAMAAGIPILGFDFGATPDIVEHTVHGYLAKPDDYDDLLNGLEYIYRHRDKLSIFCKGRAQEYDWHNIAGQIAHVYDLAAGDGYELPVSVVIPCHNYAEYLPDAIQSVLFQEVDFEYELILIDDGSTDNSLEIMHNFAADNPKITVLSQQNHGVAFTRNRAIQSARGEYIVCLDADDAMGQGFLQVCYNTIRNDRTIGIVFTGIESNGIKSQWGQSYDYKEQLDRHNQIPSLCMFRKSAWARVGGYRGVYTPAEDAELWLRILTYGYTAKIASKEPLFKYRVHNKSLSTPIRLNQVKEPDWTGDKDYIRLNPPMASDYPPRNISHPVRNFDQPVVSVIIPVGRGHEKRVLHAIDTVMCQTFWEWECIVVLDTPNPVDLSRYPFVKAHNTGAGAGASEARNVGIENAKGEFVFFLDADDAILPDCLQKMVSKFRRTGKYVYSDWIQNTIQGNTEIGYALDNMSQSIFTQTFQHLNSCLIPTKIVKEVGMFDTTLESWEDVDLYMKLAAHGLCGVRIPEPLVVYNYNSGTLRESGEKSKQDKIDLLTKRYSDYIERGKTVVCGCTGVKKSIAPSNGVEETGEMILAEYIGENTAGLDVKGAATGQLYRRLKSGDQKFVYAADFQAMPEFFREISHYVAT